MPAERAPMRKVREVLRLRHALGVSERLIAVSRSASSRSTVGEYLRRAAVIGITWPVPEGWTTPSWSGGCSRRRRSTQTPARPLPDWPHVHEELKRRGVTLMLLWEEYRAEHADGYGYSRFCDLYGIGARPSRRRCGRRTRPARSCSSISPATRCRCSMPRPATERRAHIFVAVLGASNYTYAEARWQRGAGRLDRRPRQRLHHDRRRAEGGGLRQPQGRRHRGVPLRARHQPHLPGSRRRTTALRSCRRGRASRATRPRSKWRCSSSSASSWRGCATGASSRSIELNAAIREIVADLNAKHHAQARRQPARAVGDDRPAGAQSAAGRALPVCRVEEVPGRARLSRRDRTTLSTRCPRA